MASIRRTLSPVPRPVALQNGEVCSVASPLSRSSSSPQHYPPDGGLLSSLFGSLDSQAFVFGILSPRSSRPLERSKPRVQMWRRSLFHFFICFMVGVFMGLTPFASMNLSMNPMSKHQSFSFEVISTVGNFQSHENVTRTVSRLDGGDVRRSATLKSEVEDLELMDETHEDKFDTQPLSEDSNLVLRKLLIIVTPTNAGPFQAYDLIRLAQSLKLVPSPLLWIVVEMTSQSAETADILRRTGVMYRHLVCYKNLTDINDAYIHQRNVALSHIETHRLDGIVYFADDNNVYLADLFEQMRQIRRFGTWTVAKLTGNKRQAILEGPVCNETQVIGWYINESHLRFQRFHAEMSGFAFNSTILWDPKRWHRPTLEPIRQLDTVKDGFQISTFIEQVVEDETQMEALLQDCSRIMVWNIYLAPSASFYPSKWLMKNNLDVILPLT
ncbi:probable beta-1,4-xylosyltransferase IRX9H isoform X2 [Alnus glutinosa]|uniref:probable beta-1,4-xylosyltransferase IRX9H isoform X2 n=1 Tax=Alnus glutinosa TaxID=3517 RepID=UPI002D77ABCC|nr:probable beta-1,4-xylosyltransferase IRX9H isoform X2 [Alnus glutinosa]